VNIRTGSYDERYKFTGYEKDEESGLSYMGARYYNSIWGVDISSDAYWWKYPWISSYAHCGNNPIMNVDPDGNTFGNYRTSRIEYSSGAFRVNLGNLHRYTRNNFQAAANNSANWKPGEIGISTVVGTLQMAKPTQISNNMATLDQTNGAATGNPTTVTTQAETANSTGMPDKRVKPHTMNSGGTTSVLGVSAGPKGAAGLMLALDGFFVAYDILTAYWVLDDMNRIKSDQGLLKAAFNAVIENINLVDQKYRNASDLSTIANFVYQGVNNTGNQDITNIGINILKSVGKYDPNKIKPATTE
jgi:RHS repeat-associated protein